MNDRSRNDEQGADHGSVDPYRYLTSGSGEDASYLPSEVVQERAAQSSAAPGASSPATGGPHGGEDEEADDVTVGMTRRELRELRARRAARAAANPAGGAAADGAAAEPSAAADETAVVALPPGTDDEATATLAAVTDGDATPAPGAPGAPAWRTPAVPVAGSGVGPGTIGRHDGEGDASALAPGWHDPAPRRRSPLPWIIGGVLLVIALVVAGVLLLGGGSGGDGEESGSASPTPTEEATGLAAVLPPTVTGGEFADTGATGVTYTLGADGLVANPVPPAGATESLVGVYDGGAEPVTLTGSSFASTQEALDAATAAATALGTAVDTGVVFPAEDLGTYWTFNNDGLVTVVWHDGAENVFTVVSEDAEDALGFYSGLEF